MWLYDFFLRCYRYESRINFTLKHYCFLKGNHATLQRDNIVCTIFSMSVRVLHDAIECTRARHIIYYICYTRKYHTMVLDLSIFLYHVGS